jgi:hypothetical protein
MNISLFSLKMNKNHQKPIYLIDKSKNYITVSESELVNADMHHFYGWKCMMVPTNITIDENGEVCQAHCDQRHHLGNIFDETYYFVPPPPRLVQCNQTLCKCAVDQRMPKFRSEEWYKTRPFQLSKILGEIISIQPTRYDEMIFTLDLFITDQCNFQCTYCTPGIRSGRMNLDRVRTLFDRVTDAFRGYSLRVTILGGEPTLYKYLPEAVQQLKVSNSNNRIVVLTNGFRDESYLQQLALSSHLCFSVHLKQPRVDLLAQKIAKIALHTSQLQVLILYPAGYQKALYQFLSKFPPHFNFLCFISKIKLYYNDPCTQDYEYSDKEDALLQHLSECFSRRENPYYVSS